jgi:hypothetical protein
MGAVKSLWEKAIELLLEQAEVAAWEVRVGLLERERRVIAMRGSNERIWRMIN